MNCVSMVPNSYQSYYQDNADYYLKLLMNFGLLKSPEHYYFFPVLGNDNVNNDFKSTWRTFPYLMQN